MLKVEEKLCCLSVCLQAFSLSCICLGVYTIVSTTATDVCEGGILCIGTGGRELILLFFSL